MLRARGSRGGRPAVLTLLSAAALLAGCLGATDGPTTTDAVSSDPPVLVSPRATEPPVTEPPTTDPTATTPATATDHPTDQPAITDSPAADCSGTDENRAFFSQAAASIDWAVVCAVLPDGWFLVSGSFQLASGGRVEVAYRGPAGASLALVEGNVCQGDEVHECAPRDTLIGPATFAGMAAELGQVGSGLVLDVNRGSNPMWRASGVGLAEDAFLAIGEAAIVVGD